MLCSFIAINFTIQSSTCKEQFTAFLTFSPPSVVLAIVTTAYKKQNLPTYTMRCQPFDYVLLLHSYTDLDDYDGQMIPEGK